MTPPMTSVSLLKVLSEDALSPRWSEFVGKYATTIKGFLLKYFPTVDADEVFNDTLIALVSKLPLYRYDPDVKGHFRNYLIGIVRFKAIEQLKKRRRYDEVKNAVSSEHQLCWEYQKRSYSVDLRSWQREAYESALVQFMADQTIPTRDKEIFRRIVQLEESPQAVADVFGVTRNNVDQIKARMVARLKKLALQYAGICD